MKTTSGIIVAPAALGRWIGVLALGLLLGSGLRAELKLPAIIGDHMVIQQKLADPVWGWDTPGTKVTVTFAGKSQTAVAGPDGRWQVKLEPQAANATPQILTISGTTRREIQDVLVGEVWFCSGQSNMGFPLNEATTGDLEGAATNRPGLRLITVPQLGTQELKRDFKGAWEAANPETVKRFSAVGLLYGRMIHDIVGVPVGLIDNAWGGSSAEAWIRRESIEQESRFKDLMESVRKREASLTSGQGRLDFEAAMTKWKSDSEKAKQGNTKPPAAPRDWLTGNARPGNIFAGMVNPTLGYGLKGVIWYQGESNAGRAWEYAALFPFLIEQWRKEWGQGDFPFYWVQLANFTAAKPEPGESSWAELREAQTATMKLPNTGQAVIIDLGEGSDIHPRDKYGVATRLVRWALVKDYGQDFAYRSPEFKSLAITGSKVTLTINCFGSALRPFGVKEPVGLAICGEDKVWHWASGRIIDYDQVEVWSDAVAAPMAVRYAWADNPRGNLYANNGLPVTPFRTDNFEMSTRLKAAAKSATP